MKLPNPARSPHDPKPSNTRLDNNSKSGGTAVTDLLMPHARLRERLAKHRLGRKLFYAVNIAQHKASADKVPAGTSSWYMGVTKHAHLSEVVAYLGTNHTQYKLFSVIREPFSWVESQYNYISTRPLHARHAEVKDMSFADFVTDFIESKHGLQTDMLRSVRGLDGRIARLSALFTLDSVAQDTSSLIVYLGLPARSIPMPPRNRSTKRASLVDLPATLQRRLTDYLSANITAYTAVSNAGGAQITTPDAPLFLPEIATP